MEYVILQNKLLGTGYFNNDEWLDKYIKLIINNNLSKKIKYKSAKHHILPRCYYTLNNIEVDNSSENTVFLLHADHVLAHLYLALSTSDASFRRKNLSSMWFVLSKSSASRPQCIKDNPNEISNLISYIESLKSDKLLIYEKPKEACQVVTGSTWYNNGDIEKYFSETDVIPDGFIKGRLSSDKYHTNAIDRIWINDGVHQLHIKVEESYQYLEQGFTTGMMYRGDEWYNNVAFALKNKSEDWCKNISEGKQKFFENNPNFRNDGNFKIGCEPHNKNKKWITNGVENRFICIDEYDKWSAEGWHWGATQKRNKKVKVIFTDNTYKWVSITSVDKYIKEGYVVDYSSLDTEVQ